jgi:uncharacterized protein GlcG (DUF336 family)
MTVEQAFEILDRGQKAAEEQGVQASIAVTDEAGHLVAFVRMDGASFMTPPIAMSKAWTAAAVKMSTGVLGTFLAPETTFLTGAIAATDGRFLPTPGGFPFAVDDQVVGGVGVSGGSSEQDAAIAEAAVTAA